MNRFIEFSPNQSYFITFDPSTHYPVGTLERFIVAIVEKIDIDNFYPKKDRGGETPHHPRAMLAILLYGFSRGIFSYRKIAEACFKDTGFMFLSSYSTPCYSTISRFVTHHKNEIIKVFKLLVYLAYKEGYIDYNLTAIDGTKIKANASDQYSGTYDDFSEKAKKLEVKIKEALKKLEESTDDESKKYWKNKTKYYETRYKIFSTFLNENQKNDSKIDKEVKVNIIDPESRRMKVDGKKIGPAYNIQVTVCGKKCFITSLYISDLENDKQLLNTMIEVLRTTAPSSSLHQIVLGKILADNGYYSIKSIVEAINNDHDVFVPPCSSKKLYLEEKCKGKKIGIRDCSITYKDSKITVECPGKRKFTEYGLRKNKDDFYYIFRVRNTEGCTGCKCYAKCLSHLKNKNSKSFEVNQKLIDNWDTLEKYNNKIKSDKGKMTYSKRMGLIEKVFGYLKHVVGMRQVLVRGLDKVKTICSIAFTTFNIKRLLKLTGGHIS